MHNNSSSGNSSTRRNNTTSSNNSLESPGNSNTSSANNSDMEYSSNNIMMNENIAQLDGIIEWVDDAGVSHVRFFFIIRVCVLFMLRELYIDDVFFYLLILGSRDRHISRLSSPSGPERGGRTVHAGRMILVLFYIYYRL
jgi:hypothetical protein